MKPHRFELDRREDVRNDDRYGVLFALISAYLGEHMDMDCRALVVIAVTSDGHVDVMNGGQSINFDFNQILRELVEGNIDLNRPTEGGVH